MIPLVGALHVITANVENSISQKQVLLICCLFRVSMVTWENSSNIVRALLSWLLWWEGKLWLEFSYLSAGWFL